MDSLPAYRAAVVLNSGHRWQYIEDKLTSQRQKRWLKKAKDDVKRFWKDNWKRKYTVNTQTESSTTVNSYPMHDPDDFEQFLTPVSYYTVSSQ